MDWTVQILEPNRILMFGLKIETEKLVIIK